MISGVGTELAASRAASAQSTLSPDDALKALMDGNRRFVERRLTSLGGHRHTDAAYRGEAGALRLRARLRRLPCARSSSSSTRASAMSSSTASPATSRPRKIIASIEYGAAVLGTSVLMVLGHGNCGAVKATIAANAVPGQISSLVQLSPAGGEPGEWRSRRGDRGQCADPGPAPPRNCPTVVAGLVQERQDQSRGRRLRSRQRQGEPAGLTLKRPAACCPANGCGRLVTHEKRTGAVPIGRGSARALGARFRRFLRAHADCRL